MKNALNHFGKISLKKITLTLLSLGAFLFAPVSFSQTVNKANILEGPNWQYFAKLEQAGFLMLDGNRQALESKNAESFYVPASTTKLITAFLALQHWGENYRFKTEFYLKNVKDDSATLVVKGYGDPFLVSEELQLVAKKLKEKLHTNGVKQINGIELDSSFYQPGLVMPGTSKSDNPYDAIPGAIAANFNSIYIVKRGKLLLSAEPQTPMTKSGLVVAHKIKTYKTKSSGKYSRVNLGTDFELNQRYFAELLSAFLQQNGVEVLKKVSVNVLLKPNEKNITPLYTHFNSRTLAEVIKPMMKYSTNFIANQLALNLSVDILGGEASQQKVAKVYRQQLTQYFGWQDFYIEDGAGLSRNNRLRPSQLIDVLQAFRPWAKLLPEIEPSVIAKSGSLIGVSTLAGYIKKQDALMPFAMMINQRVPYHFRNKLAKELAQAY
ncbi:D-alanyl-D-alanine carboxypeptidase/D-alanyl-D-alanine-endopeptidase [Thiomicrorhabdus sp. Milos-T2]|uniref:D-alanyl-D-alanine carboxypeptidase/D-alanyl-D-alanine-endopeptidase n=1 Tax=Thiomicrorhabdus sp. Milos-T2 TaxID=90814 RepID=UPI00068E500E|nr:D-alanyl-D-alanine carboxypeptidase [Thiomicrorhabdus sp. Milos-T2]